MSLNSPNRASPWADSSAEAPVAPDAPLYNSRLADNYVEYLERFYPDVDIDAILAAAGTNRQETSDPSKWFDQEAVNRFHAAMEARIDDPELCRMAGRFGADARAMGPIKQVAIGLLNPGIFYARFGKVMSLVTRGAEGVGRPLGRNRVEVFTRPKPGVDEQPFQCQNRLGGLEGAGYVFLGLYPEIEHPECFHRGDPHCRYIISWETTPSFRWRRIRSIAIIAGALLSAVAFPLLSLTWWSLLSLGALFFVIFADHRYSSHELKQLRFIIENQGQYAKELIDEVNTRHAHSLLQRTVAEASSRRLQLEQFLEQVITAISEVIDYEDLQIELEDGQGCVLQAVSLNREHDTPQTKHFRPMQPPTPALSGVVTAVPIIYNDEQLGQLILVHREKARSLTGPELTLLEGVAAQIAVGVDNARSFRELEVSEGKYRDLVESADSAILRFEPTGALTYYNSFAQELFGFEAGGPTGPSMLGAVFPDSNDAQHALSELTRALEQHPDHLTVIETYEEAALSTRRPIAWTFKGIVELGGSVDEVLAIGADITALRRADREREKLSRQLDQAQKLEAIGTLAGGVAHDFNNLLTGIMGNVVVLLERLTRDPESLQMLHDVETLARSAADLIQQLLGFARRGKYEVEPININDLVGETLRLFLRTKKELEHELDTDSSLWLVQADRSQLEQTLLNVYVNAGQAMPKGGKLTVVTTNLLIDTADSEKRQIAPGAYVGITIRDWGVGMSPDVLEHIFEPFFTTKERERGTGLGLASAYGVIRNHGGIITVESTPGEGTTFEILLPASPEANPSLNNERPKTVKGTGTILVVDDEMLVLKAARRVLRQLGYDVLIANDGHQAIEIYRAHGDRIDLVILDMIMPTMSGPEVFTALSEEDPSVRVLLSSGYSIGDEASKVLEQGALGFLQKPYDDNQISRKIHDVLRGRFKPLSQPFYCTEPDIATSKPFGRS